MGFGCGFRMSFYIAFCDTEHSLLVARCWLRVELQKLPVVYFFVAGQSKIFAFFGREKSR